MKAKSIISMLIIAIIIVLILIVFKTTERIIEDYGKESEKGESTNNKETEQELPTLKPGSESTEAGEETGGTGGAGGGAGGGSTTSENQTLPSDISTKPCSFYFENYGACAGQCPSGTCTQEGQSCYCK